MYTTWYNGSTEYNWDVDKLMSVLKADFRNKTLINVEMLFEVTICSTSQLFY